MASGDLYLSQPLGLLEHSKMDRVASDVVEADKLLSAVGKFLS